MRGRSPHQNSNYTKMKYKAKKVNGKKIDEHRLVMEKHLGRKLTKEEVVHHIDGDKSNNKIKNLKLYPNKKSHTKFHYENGDLELKPGTNKRKLINGKLKCSRCNVIKELSEFWKNKNCHLGYNGTCKKCHIIRRKSSNRRVELLKTASRLCNLSRIKQALHGTQVNS